ncbi:MAG: ORF6N domain-containing protein [Bacteroidales bacterium]|nr:ORF6N domain-containing protein [Bacteroidales bacterium]
MDKNEIAIIQNKIYVFRGQQVMTDRDIAELYGVETRRLNEQVRRNVSRFPEEFCFQLTESEFQNLMSQNATSSWGGTRKLPFVFTEQGVAMLSAVLKSETAIKASVQIMKAFVAMRRFLVSNAQIFQRLDALEMHQFDADKQIAELFSLMDKYKVADIQGIFYQGQIFDAYAKSQSFIVQAQQDIILIDNYVDVSVLERLATKNSGVAVTIYTSQKSKLTPQDIQNFNAQYPPLTVNYTEKMHDRFLIIDHKILYHIGASLKDLGKKCFAFDLFDASFIPDILARL